MLLVLSVLTVSCGSYGSLYNSDGIYGDSSDDSDVIIVSNTSKRTMADVDKKYFGKELELNPNYGEFFTDIESYTSVENDTIVRDSLNYSPKAWGYNDNNTTVVINIDNGFDDIDRYWMAMTYWDYYPFYSYYRPFRWRARGLYNPWGWGFGFAGPAWGYNDPFYNPWVFYTPYNYGFWRYSNYRNGNFRYNRNGYASYSRRNTNYSSVNTRRYLTNTVTPLPSNRRTSSILRGNTRINTNSSNTIRRRSNTITNPNRGSNTRVRSGNSGNTVRSSNSRGATRTRVKPVQSSSRRSSGTTRGSSGRRGNRS